ncbi:MAG: YraN family protein [Tissierellales bacterium]|nr:YraN family protein [Tissierellales bacterium]MBN2827973.1 YraN family protein [Tissierellales bacterium]
MNKREIGTQSEKLVVDFLVEKGYEILEINFRNRIAEIDIIVKSMDIICFIEVKSRKSLKYGLPREAVNKKKMNQMIKGAMSYINYKNLKNMKYRFDVVEVYINESRINHIENAFWL